MTETNTIHTAGLKLAYDFDNEETADALIIGKAVTNPITLKTKSKTAEISPNGIFILSPGTKCDFICNRKDIFRIAIRWKDENYTAAKPILDFLEKVRSIFPFLNAEAEEITEHLRKSVESRDNISEDRIKALVSALFFCVYDALSPTVTGYCSENEVSGFCIDRTLRNYLIDNYLNEKFKGDISLTEAADLAGVSSKQLNRISVKVYGRTFYQQVTYLRIQKAKQLMDENPQLSIEEVAYAVGFSTHTGFYKAFKKITGIIPVDYKRKVRNKPQTGEKK